MGQTLCKWLPSTRTVCVETQEAAVLREPGESQVSLHAAPCRWAEGCWGSACGGEGGRGTQGLLRRHGQGPSAPWPGGHGWAMAACWHRWACTAPSPPRPPALPLSWHGRHRAAPGTAPGGTWPRKALTAVTLSSPACVLCAQGDADPDIYGRKLIISGIYFHEFCAVSSLTAPSTILQKMVPSFLP